VGDKGKGN